jgi:hypothetical protein
MSEEVSVSSRGEVLERRAAETALKIELKIPLVVPTIPDAMLCCDSGTWVSAKRLETRYETSAPMTPITFCYFLHLEMGGTHCGKRHGPVGKSERLECTKYTRNRIARHSNCE